MKPEIAKLWVDALRSGEYVQGKGRLRSAHNEFCCLGVLCNLHAQLHPHIATAQKYACSYLDKRKVLPLDVRTWAGLASRGGTYNGNHGFYTLTADNDSGKTFSQIARIIEVYTEEL